ncbi:MAG TPA: YfiR family protein [Candidatus Acidoferrales bacterium]|nr:YfiR family protein [Candidatus Acidoferrales bacterium]
MARSKPAAPAEQWRRCGRTARWRAAAAGIVILSIFSVSVRTFAQSDSPNEYQVKAAFLFNFAKFVDWPPGTYANAQSPFAICVLGDDPFGHVLENTLAGKSLGAHPVVLRRTKDLAEARRCQVVFVSSSEMHRYGEVVEGVRGARVLLVGETDGFASSGGAIEFTLEGNHVRFAINPEAAQRAGLTLSSKLLMLARIVHDGGYAGKS